MYYWKTVFRPDSSDVRFMDRHKVERIYLRMFDVSVNQYAHTVEDRTVPNATLRFDNDDFYYLLSDSVMAKEFVPVVYITLDAMKEMEGYEDVLASNIVTRVRNMCSYNGIINVSELQLDCDWTKSTEFPFFRLCRMIREEFKRLELPWRLSSTIRLHQLARKVPPVDCGVLMVYNTGNFNDPDAANSIIDVADVEPYLKHLPSYPLHLDVAYPVYSWQLLFRERSFMGLLNGVNLADSTRFEQRRKNVYMALRDIPYRDFIIRAGDMVRSEAATFRDVSAVRELIEQRMSARPHSNILYHLDSKNLSKYTDNEIDAVFAVGR